ncbi:hypothetical protein BKA65DRAFT_559489 [Rhexocercosporidium sp. MPI-PUGE-AT-0058]|nr:hypothetical protein BKA65DRAFT_559489 [Rhexocercosporidium sp. MPI-PUGE-AT-0058]
MSTCSSCLATVHNSEASQTDYDTAANSEYSEVDRNTAGQPEASAIDPITTVDSDQPEPKVACNWCPDTEFASTNDLNTPIADYHGYKCPFCYLNDLKKHLAKFHTSFYLVRPTVAGTSAGAGAVAKENENIMDSPLVDSLAYDIVLPNGTSASAVSNPTDVIECTFDSASDGTPASASDLFVKTTYFFCEESGLDLENKVSYDSHMKFAPTHLWFPRPQAQF